MPQYKGHEVSDELLKAIQDDVKSAEASEDRLAEIRAAERKSYAKDIKTMIAKAMPGLVEGISADIHVRDYISEIAERAQKQKPAAAEPQIKETPEQMSSRLKSENDKILAEERAKLRREAALNETVSIAIGKYGLDPDYKDAFVTKLNSLHPVEVIEDRVSFRDGDGYLYDKQSKAAGSEFVAEKLLTAYPKLKVATQPGPNLHTDAVTTKTLDKSASGKFEQKVGAMLQNIQQKAG